MSPFEGKKFQSLLAFGGGGEGRTQEGGRRKTEEDLLPRPFVF